MSNLKKQAIWTLGSSFIAAILQIILLMILARTLSTSDLGVLAILQVFLGIALVFQDAGLSNFHIHKQEINENQLSSLFIFCFLLGCLIAICVWLLAPFIAEFYTVTKLDELVSTLSVQFILVSLCTLYQADLIKTFKQVLLAKIEIFSRIISFFSTLYFLIISEAGLMAVVYGMLLGSLFKLILLWQFAKKGFHPCYKPDWAIVPQAWRYGYFQLLSQLINQLRTQADQLIIGKLLGMEALGFYSLAKELVLKPARFIQPLIQRLLLPRFAKQQNNREKQQYIFLRSIHMLGWTNGALYSLIALLAWPLTWLLYGEGFSITASLLSILCVFAMIRPVGAVLASVAQANGRTDVEFQWNLFAGIIMITSIGLAAMSSEISTVAATLSLIQIFLTVAAYYFFNQKLKTNIPVSDLWVVLPPTLITILSAIAGTQISDYISGL